MENSAQIFALALGLSSPWIIENIKFDQETSRLDIYLKFERGTKFLMNDTNEYTAHDTVERQWEHLNFFQHRCYLHAKVPRVKQKDGKIQTQPVPWARKGSGFTLLFEAFAMLLIENEMPVNKAAKILKVYPNRLWRVFSYWISIAHQKDTITDLDKVGFDETSSRKGHNYVTTMVDLKERRVLFATQGKDATCIGKSIDYLKEKHVDVQQIKQVCIDMSPAFISGCTQYIEQAAITFDKFHVIKEINKAMDSLRKLERVGNTMLKKL